MSASQGGYPPQGYPADDPYSQGQPQQFGGQPEQPGTEPSLQGGSIAPASSSAQVGGHKKRAYASQAFEFGAGANSALGGQPKGGGSYPVAQGYGGYPQQPQVAQQYGYQQPGPAVDQPSPTLAGPAVPGYGDPATTGVGGYQPPAAGYPPQGGVSGVTNQFGQLGIGGQPQPAPQQGIQKPHVLNQLYPTDLISQPFNVSELDLPPPPIVLPPNVLCPNPIEGHCLADRFSRASHHPLTRMLPSNMYDRPSMPYQLVIHCSRSPVFRSL
jgi:protein transport protein SEC24